MRVEQDSLGSISLESDCLYGIQTARSLVNLTFSDSKLKDYPEVILALSVVKQACARANAQTGTIPSDIGDLLENACRLLASGNYNEHFPVDMLHGGGYIAFNQNINEVLANLANQSQGHAPGSNSPVSPKKHANASQSTADVCHTAVRIAIFRRASDLLAQLESAADAMGALKAKFSHITTLARTCLRDAMPVSLGETFGAFEALLRRRQEKLTASLSCLSEVNLGGTVIGSGDGATPAYALAVVQILSELLSDMPVYRRANLYDAAQNIDDLASISAELRILSEGLIKICKDLRLLASGPNGGFGELILPGVQEGSSFFIGKFNPIVPETVIQACMQVLGADRVVQAAHEHGELNLNIFEGAAVKNILDATKMLKNALALLTDKCILGIEADEARCRTLVNMQAASSANTVKSEVR